MKNIRRIIRKFTLKTITMIVYPIFVIFSWMLKLVFGLGRYIVYMLVGICGIMIAIDSSSKGFDIMMLKDAAGFIAAGLICLMFPLISNIMNGMKYKMKRILHTPVIVRSPLKYTI